jgi:hypothetical protein
MLRNISGRGKGRAEIDVAPAHRTIWLGIGVKNPRFCLKSGVSIVRLPFRDSKAGPEAHGRHDMETLARKIDRFNLGGDNPG